MFWLFSTKDLCSQIHSMERISQFFWEGWKSSLKSTKLKIKASEPHSSAEQSLSRREGSLVIGLLRPLDGWVDSEWGLGALLLALPQGGCLALWRFERRSLLLWLSRWLSSKRMCLPMQETQETRVRSLGWEDPLEEEMATCSILAQKTPWTEEPGRLQTMGLQKSWMWLSIAQRSSRTALGVFLGLLSCCTVGFDIMWLYLGPPQAFARGVSKGFLERIASGPLLSGQVQLVQELPRERNLGLLWSFSPTPRGSLIK